MKIVLFSHPSFIGSQSMPRYANMLYEGMLERGHIVELWTAKSVVSHIFKNKWGGYIDQYILFPVVVRQKLKKISEDTLFVFADQALGPWIPLVADRKHVVHCHDFLAQYSALDQLIDNRVNWSGKLYQAYIRRGYRKAKQFICISEKTQQDLNYFMQRKTFNSHVIYNGLNPVFQPAIMAQADIVDYLSAKYRLNLSRGFILHVGGNQFYKNRVGVVEIFNQLHTETGLSLVLIGQQPDNHLLDCILQSQYQAEICILSQVDDPDLVLFYQAARFFLFPSLEEGFGWPIAEAQACGCPVVTTNKTPMTEVGEQAAVYLPRKIKENQVWAQESATIIIRFLQESESQLRNRINQGFENTRRFNQQHFFDQLEACYLDIFNS